MAVAVGISTINALTLCPALCAQWLRPKEQGVLSEERVKKMPWYKRWKYRFATGWNAGFERLTAWYQRGAGGFIRHPWVCFCMAVVGLGLMALLMNHTKTSLIPEEDQGTVMINIDTPAGSSLATTDSIVRMVEERLSAIPEVEELNAVSGFGLISGESSTAACLILKLKPWDERNGREHSVDAVIGQVYARTADLKDISIFAMTPAQISGYGEGNALDVNVQDKAGGDMQQLYDYAQQFIGALNQRKEIAMAFSSFRLNNPQWEVSVDAAKCQRSGITANEVLACLSGYYGGQYVSDFNRFGKVYKVQIMGDPKQREAVLTFTKTVLSAGNEVNNALHNYQTCVEKQTLYDSEEEALERAVRATRLKMQYGSTTYLEVLTAQNSLLNAQLTQIANRMQALQSVVTLYHALGGGNDYAAE